MMSKLLIIAERLLEKGMFVMTGQTEKIFIRSAILSDSGEELTIRFSVEDFDRDFVWHFNVDRLNDEN